jgi:glutamine synthetase
VQFVRLAFVDVLGIAKNVTIPVAELERAVEGTIAFDGGSIDGFVRGEEADMLLRPDLGTFTILPWTAGGAVEARFFCDIATPDGESFEGCPRSTLRRVLDGARDVLAGLRVALEIEFYLFALAEGEPVPAAGDVGSYFDLSAGDRGERARIEMVTSLGAMDVAVAGAHHEHGAGQHEIDLRDADVLTAADALVTTRLVAKQVAARHGLHATFMPKPTESSAGSGVHVYLAIPATPFDGAPSDADDRLGEDVLFAVGGLLEHAPAFTAVCNPTVNSYKRLVAAWDAPIYTAWSLRSPNSLVRIPSSPSDGPRIEVRSPDPSCNPYLALGALIASAADGMREHMLPGEPLAGSTYEMSERDRSLRRIRTLPRSLRQAIDELARDTVVRGALGDHIFAAFRDAKLAEYERYRRAVHPWERDAYLRVY